MGIPNATPWSWQIEHVDPNSLKIPDDHPRKHSRSKIERWKALLGENDFIIPIVIGPNREVVTGVARVIAAREIGMQTIPTLPQAQLTPSQIKRIRLFDNKIQEGSTWDELLLATDLKFLIGEGYDGLKLGFETAELDALLSSPTSSINEGADVLTPPEPEDTVTVLGDLWIVGDHRVLCADSREDEALAQLMSGETAAVCLTDPPYNVPIKGHVSGNGAAQHEEFAMGVGEFTREQFLAFLSLILSCMTKWTKPGGLIYVFMDWRSIDVLMAAARSLGLKHVNTCVWSKTNAGMGSFYRSQHEFVGVFVKPGGRATNNVQLGKHGRNRSNVWQCAGANAFGQTRDADLADHPTVKPTELLENALKDCTKRGEIVLDVFGGSGATMLAAERCGRKARLIEIDPRYVDVTLNRMRRVFELEPVLASTGQSFDEVAAERRAATQN
jgi:DNA modification methylase